MVNPLTKAASDVFEILSPLSSEERARVLNAARALLGEGYSEPPANARMAAAGESQSGGASDDVGLPAPALAWMRKNGISVEQLENSFHLGDGKVQVISLIGSPKKKSDQTVSAYLALGAASFLSNGDSSFSDDEARTLCQHFGCYDVTNHTKNVKALGNRVTGSKNSGWKLTAPGLTAVAEMVKSG